MCAVLVFGTVGSIAECLRAALKLAHIRLLTGVGTQMCFEVLEARIRLVAPGKLKQFQKKPTKNRSQISKQERKLNKLHMRTQQLSYFLQQWQEQFVKYVIIIISPDLAK